MDVISENTQLIINGYLDNPIIHAQGRGAVVSFPVEDCEAGENVLAYKGHINIINAEFVASKRKKIFEPYSLKADDDPLLLAAQFLFNSQIKGPEKSPFRGACYCIYDFNDQSHRMSNWVWNNAVVVNAMVELYKSNLYPSWNDEFKRLAVENGVIIPSLILLSYLKVWRPLTG
jgi:hypothetical protein